MKIVRAKHQNEIFYGELVEDKVIRYEGSPLVVWESTEEIYKRAVIPFYILILSLISSSLLIKPKSNKYLKYYKSFVFSFGFLFIIFSQIGSKFVTQNLIYDLLVLVAPIIFVLLFYLIILFRTKFKLKYL